MKIGFRQGLVSYQKNGFNQPSFLITSATPNGVAFDVSPTPTVVTFAHGASNYLMVFDTDVDPAWVVVPGPTAYLYWDIDLLTGAVTRGQTTLAPLSQLTAPVAPADGQMWFDLTTTKMKYWSSARNKWYDCVRVFAGYVINGNNTQIVPYGAGSQVGLIEDVDAGYLLFDASAPSPTPAKLYPQGEFLTTTSPVRVKTTSGTSGVVAMPLNAFVPVRATENIPKFSIVYFSGEDAIGLASSNASLPMPKTPVGIVQEDLDVNEIGVLTQNGEISYDQWDWSASIGKPLYVGDVGDITFIRPNTLMAYRIGFVKNATTILFNVDAETLPQVYQSSADDVVIDGTLPITAVYTTPMGERHWQITMPAATNSQNGYATAIQIAELEDHETRLTQAELDILGKAPLVHTHVIADTTGLQSALDTLTNGKADKTVPASPGNFAALTGTGNLSDSSYSPSSFALVVHTHVIADVTGLQTALNGKAALVHSHVAGDITGGTSGYFLTSNGGGLGQWTPLGSIDLHSDVDTTSVAPTVGQVLKWDGTNWVPAADSGAVIIDDLTDVDTTTVAPLSGQVLKWNGINWVPANDTTFTPGSINAFTDVDTFTTPPTVGQVLKWDGTNWVPAADDTSAAEPNTQIVYGTGAGIDSSPDFTYDVSNHRFNVNLLVSDDQAQVDIRSGDNALGYGTSQILLEFPDTAAASDIYINGGISLSGARAGSVEITGGEGQGTGPGGSVRLTGGDTVNDGGGDISFESGSASVADGSAGNITATGGNGVGVGSGGSFTVFAGGAVDGPAGSVNLSAGTASGTGTSGSVRLSAGGSDYIVLDPSGSVAFNGSVGAVGEVLTSNGVGSPPAWLAPSVTSEPANQIVYGTGSGVDSSPDFFFDPATNALSLNSAVVNNAGGFVQLFTAANTGGDGGGSVIISPPGATAGSVTATAGTAATSGLNGGSVNLFAGNSADAAGGQINIASGGTTGGTGAGGLLYLSAGASNGGLGGQLLMVAGTGVSGGAAVLTAGDATTGAAGAVLITAGGSSSGASGSVVIAAGYNVGDSSSGTIQLKTGAGVVQVEVFDNGSVAFNGSAGTAGQVLTSAGPSAAPTWTSNLVAPNYQYVIGDGSTTAYSALTVNTIANGGGKSYLQVFINGIKQREGAGASYTVTGANEVTFNVAPALNDDVEFYAFA